MQFSRFLALPFASYVGFIFLEKINAVALEPVARVLKGIIHCTDALCLIRVPSVPVQQGYEQNKTAHL